ncbi:MAG: alpha/beta hydrolase [Saprospiraceae bacterium]
MKTFAWVFFICNSILVSAQHDSTATFITSFDGTKIYFETHGSGRPILLIHGFTGDGSGWKRSALFNDLIAGNYMPVLVDLRGNGKSDKPHDAKAYSDDAEAKDLIAVMNHLGVKSYDALGYSRGSIILARLLVFDPRIQKGILGGMGSDFTNPEWPRKVLFYHTLAGDTIVESLTPMIKRIESQGLDRIALSLMQKEQPSTSALTLGKLINKVLVISGNEDFENGSSKELAEMIPRCTYVNVPGKHGGTSNTKAFSNEVLTFLKD